jgi:hypothetical protein
MSANRLASWITAAAALDTAKRVELHFSGSGVNQDSSEPGRSVTIL